MGERPRVDAGDLSEGGFEGTVGLRPRLHLSDEDLGLLASDAGHQTRLHRARLPRATRSDEGSEALGTDDARDEAVDELVLPEEPGVVGLAEGTQPEVRVLDPSAFRRTLIRAIGNGVEVRVLEEYLLLDAPQPGRGRDPQLLAEDVAGGLVGAQRVGLATRPIEGDHVQRP